MRICIQTWCIASLYEDLAGIGFGSPGVKVNVTVPKNGKMVSGQLLELGMRYCNQTWCLASFY
jgi:hypothetical protein